MREHDDDDVEEIASTGRPASHIHDTRLSFAFADFPFRNIKSRIHLRWPRNKGEKSGGNSSPSIGDEHPSSAMKD